MFKLIKKDSIIFKRYITYSIIFYSALNLLLSMTIIYSKLSPWKYLVLLTWIKNDIFLGLSIFITIILCTVFNYIIIFKENYQFTLSLNVSRGKIYFSKILTGYIFNVMIISLFFSIYYIIYKFLIKGLFYLSTTDIILIIANFLIFTMIIHNLALFSLILKKANQQVKILCLLFILFIYSLTFFYLVFNCNLYNLHSFEPQYINILILLLFIFIITVFLNFKLVKRVDV